jgi:mono/diheme cytochrome c family protein
MKTRHLFAVAALGVCALFLNACGSTASLAPPVTPALVTAAGREKADAPTLTTGRSIFVSRCIQCHALQDVSRFSGPGLTAIVGIMSRRANLSPAQHDALLKYLQTVRSL